MKRIPESIVKRIEEYKNQFVGIRDFVKKWEKDISRTSIEEIKKKGEMYLEKIDSPEIPDLPIFELGKVYHIAGAIREYFIGKLAKYKVSVDYYKEIYEFGKLLYINYLREEEEYQARIAQATAATDEYLLKLKALYVKKSMEMQIIQGIKDKYDRIMERLSREFSRREVTGKKGVGYEG